MMICFQKAPEGMTLSLRTNNERRKMAYTSKELERVAILDEFDWDLKRMADAIITEREFSKQLIEKKNELEDKNVELIEEKEELEENLEAIIQADDTTTEEELQVPLFIGEDEPEKKNKK